MKKNIFAKVATIVVAFISVFTLISCSDEVSKAKDPIVKVETKEVEIPVLVEKDKIVYVNTSYNSWFDGSILTFNGKSILKVDVEHQLPVIEMAAENHKAATITGVNDLEWNDSNGQTTIGTLTKYNESDDFELMAALTPATQYSTITSLHKKVSLITCNYKLEGNLLIHANDGKDISNPIDFKLQRPYLLVDPSVDIKETIVRDTTIQIVIQNDTTILERTVTNTDTLYINVPYEVKVPVISNVVWNGEDLMINDLVAATADVLHTKPFIEMAASKHAAASITSADGLTWTDSNGQITTGIMDIFKSQDGSYEVTGTLKPAKNYSTITKLHSKVSAVKTLHTFSGTVKAIVEGKEVKKNFSFDLVRSYFLVDPSVDIKEVHDTTVVVNNTHSTDTIYQDRIVIEHDTIVNNIHTTDTLYVEVEKFVRGADINTSVVNDFGTSNATITMGGKVLLSVTMAHEHELLSVEKDVLGNVSFSEFAALKWQGTDKQITNVTVSANGTNPTVTYLRSEYKVIASGSLVLVRPIYRVTGSFQNENKDDIEYDFEMSAGYIQTYEEPTPVIITPTYTYQVDPSTKDKESDGVKSRKLTVKISKIDQDGNVVDTWKLMANTVISGAVAGYDMYVQDATIQKQEYTDSEATAGEYSYTRPVEGNEQFVETKSTHIWRYKNHWLADVGGDVYTDSQILYQSSVISFKDGDFSWSSEELGSLAKDVKVIYDKIDNDEDMQGQTRDENGLHYTYGGTHRLTVQNILNGQPWHSSTAVSPLWVVSK